METKPEIKPEPSIIEVIEQAVKALRRKNRAERLETYDFIVEYLDTVRLEARKGLAQELLDQAKLSIEVNEYKWSAGTWRKAVEGVLDEE